MLYRGVSPETNTDLWLLPLEGERQPKAFLTTPFSETYGRFSPDGRWIAYASDQSGRSEVYVAPVSGATAAYAISTNGGTQPAWNRKLGELFYLNGDVLMSSVVRLANSNVDADTPRTLFDSHKGPTQGPAYRASSDGERFLFMVSEDLPEPPAITLVTNWPALLRR